MFNDFLVKGKLVTPPIENKLENISNNEELRTLSYVKKVVAAMPELIQLVQSYVNNSFEAIKALIQKTLSGKRFQARFSEFLKVNNFDLSNINESNENWFSYLQKFCKFIAE